MLSILVDRVYKKYTLSSGFDLIKNIFIGTSQKKKDHQVLALHDISFNVLKGEAFGIIGSNGSGKSTLLQILAGTLIPTSGLVTINGRVSALLELGSGFNPEFTGIENIYLSGSILGIDRFKMAQKIEEIKEFADIGDFIEQPVRTYSSGMLMRVAFSVAIAVEPDILIIDEALSVGDILFQQKCNFKLKELIQKGITLLVVTHDTSFVLNICKRGLWLERGKMQYLGDASDCVKRYLAAMAAKSTNQFTAINVNSTKKNIQLPDSLPLNLNNSVRLGDSSIVIEDAWVLNDKKEPSMVFRLGAWMTIILKIKAMIDLYKVSCGLEIRDRHGQVVFAVGLRASNKLLNHLNCDESSIVHFKIQLNLAPGQYTLDLGCGAGNAEINFGQRVVSVAIIEVLPDISGEVVHGLVRLPYEIEL